MEQNLLQRASLISNENVNQKSFHSNFSILKKWKIDKIFLIWQRLTSSLFRIFLIMINLKTKKTDIFEIFYFIFSLIYCFCNITIPLNKDYTKYF